VRNFQLLNVTLLGLLTTLAVTANTGLAQAPASAGHKIAVVDIGYIFRNHEGIKQKLGTVEATLKAYDQELNNKKREMGQAIEALKQFNPGSPEYATQEEKAARLESDLKLEANRKRKELAEAEAKVYFESYQQIATAVQTISEHNGIHLVLRYNSEEMELQNEESVLRGLQKSVVYRAKDLDMTPYVLQLLNQPAQTAAAPAGTAPRR
jgi:Skp family chaperone for outer membrane proteins